MNYKELVTAVDQNPKLLNRRWYCASPAIPQYGFGFRFSLNNGGLEEQIFFLRTQDGSSLIASSPCTILENVNDIPWVVLSAACIMQARLKLWRTGFGHDFQIVVSNIDGATIEEFSYDTTTGTYSSGLEPLV